LREQLAEEINVDVDGAGMPAPVVRLVLDEPPTYWLSFGSNGIAEATFRVVMDPGGVDQSSVIRLDRMLSAGEGNGSSVVDALLADNALEAEGLQLDITPGLYNAADVVADLIVRVSVLKL
jgi:hypothetical protein